MTLASVPPPAASRPSLRKCKPQDARARLGGAITIWFACWLRDHHISDRDLAEILGVSLAVAQGKRTGLRDVSMKDLGRFSPRFRDELWRGYNRVLDEHAALVAAEQSNLLAHG